MPQDPAAALSVLLRTATIDDHDEILKATNAVIKADKHNEVARHAHVVALLKLDRFEDVLRVISEGGSKLEARCVLERAYALYKTGRLDEASSLLDSVGPEKRSLKHVAAQVAYRAERFGEAESIYRHLMDAEVAHEGNDLRINIEAAQAQSEWQSCASASSRTLEPWPDTFELCYNTACAHIARASLETAAKLLQRAADLCDASDDLTQEEKEAELQPIIAQRAYVYGRLGNAEQALDLYRSLNSLSNEDPDMTVVAQSNRTALQAGKSNPFLLQRQAAAWMSGAANGKLFRYQTNALLRNASLVDLQAYKTDGVRHRMHKVLDQAPHPTTRADVNTASVMNAAAQTKGLSNKELLRKVTDLSKKRPDCVGLFMINVQLHLREASLGSALSIMETFFRRLEGSTGDQARDVRFSPGLVALAVSLMRAQGREKSAKAELVKAATYWRDRPSVSAASLLREAGLELAKTSNPADLSLASTTLKKLHDQGQQHSPLVSAGLVAALAASDMSQVQHHIAELPPVEGLIGGIDVDALAGAGVVVLPGNAVTAMKRRSLDEAAGERATKRRRRTRPPKNLVEGKAPDPERWLPLRDRSTYRPKGKKGKKRAGDSTQGGLAKEEETLELVGGGGVRVEKTSAAGSSKKKKKKGKK